MHPPSPSPPEDGPSSGILHIIQDVRNLSLDNLEVQRLENARVWAQLEVDPHLGRVPLDSEIPSSAQVDSLNPTMAMLSLNEGAEMRDNESTEYVTQESTVALDLQDYHSDFAFPTAFADDLHVLFPPHSSNGPMGADSLNIEALPRPSSSISSQTSRAKRQRRRRRVTSGSAANGVLSLDYTHRHLTKSATGRKPFYQPMRPPPISSFLRRRSVSTPHRGPSHSAVELCLDTPPPSAAMAYPDYIMSLAGELGKGENVYPLWYLILTFWFPEHEGYEVVNGWTPRVPGDPEGPGYEVGMFRPVEATLAVIWKGNRARGRTAQSLAGSPVVAIQISQEPSAVATTPLTKSEMKRSAERLFGDAALYSELPTLCVLSAIGKTVWGGFVRSTDATADTSHARELKREVGEWDWFGSGWEKDVCQEYCSEQSGGNMDRCGRSRNASMLTGEGKDWESVVSSEAFDMLGRCFSALKVNCIAQ